MATLEQIKTRIPVELHDAIKRHLAKTGFTKQYWITRALMRALPKKKESAK